MGKEKEKSSVKAKSKNTGSSNETKFHHMVWQHINSSFTRNWIIPLLLILVVMAFAFQIRSGPTNLDGIDERVEQSVYSQIQQMIERQVDSKYPNMKDFEKNKIINEKLKQVQQKGVYEVSGREINIDNLIQRQTQEAKKAFQAENGQTYLNAIDPYVFYNFATDILENGHRGDKLKEKDGEQVPFASYRLAPEGRYVGEAGFHTWIEATAMKVQGVKPSDSVGEKINSIYLLPVIFSMLSVIPLYLILRKFSNDLFAFLGSLVMVSVGTFVSRTVAGFVDTDAYNVLFPLTIVAFIVFAFLYTNKKITSFLAILAGVFQGMFMWAWTPGWFIFVFLLLSLLGYLVYLVVGEYLEKKKLKDVYSSLLNDVTVIASYIVSSFVFTYVFAGMNLFKRTFDGISNAMSGIATVSETNIWPNVLSSVAELNPAGFSQIASGVGGKVVFLIAMLGLVTLTLDFSFGRKKTLLEHLNITKKSHTQVRNLFESFKPFLIGASLIWFALFIFVEGIVSLTTNSPLIYLVLLFLPVGVSLVYSFLAGERESHIFYSILLSVWIAGTVFMSLNGSRFILLLGPAFAAAFGVGLYYIYSLVNTLLTNEINIKSFIGKRIGGVIVSVTIFLIMFVPMAGNAMDISKNSVPNFDDAWFDSMKEIKENSAEDAIITSWWDFGHFFAAISDRGVTFDGASQKTPQSHWVGKLLMSNDEDVSHDILRMLNCGGNTAFDKMKEYAGGKYEDSVKVNKIIYKTFGKDITETRNIVSNNKYYDFTEGQVDDIMESLACENPPENFLITSGDMIGKAGVWAHWGSWNFTRKYVHDTYKEMSAQEIAENIDGNASQIKNLISELEAVKQRAQEQNKDKQNMVNRWLAPYPSYLQGGQKVSCSKSTNTTLSCGRGSLNIDLKTGKVESSFAQKDINIARLIYPSKGGEIKVREQESEGNFDVTLTQSSNGGFQALISQYPLGNSLFTKLYFMEGKGVEMFEKFDDRQSATGISIKVWKTNWNISKTKEESKNNINLVPQGK